MPKATGRARQTLIDSIHRQTAKAIDATFKQHAKAKTLVPAPFIAQAIKFLQSTDSTAPQRVPRAAPTKTPAQRMADDVAYRREQAYWQEQERLFANGRTATQGELDELRQKYPEQFGDDLATDFSQPARDSREDD